MSFKFRLISTASLAAHTHNNIRIYIAYMQYLALSLASHDVPRFRPVSALSISCTVLYHFIGPDGFILVLVVVHILTSSTCSKYFYTALRNQHFSPCLCYLQVDIFLTRSFGV